jgi:hypothetical protein
MDRYLESYVDSVMESQQYRNGIKLSSSWISRLFNRKSNSE